jgi:hypothetical protein
VSSMSRSCACVREGDDASWMHLNRASTMHLNRASGQDAPKSCIQEIYCSVKRDLLQCQKENY